MIQMKVLHASLREYILIWGTPIETEGHSGRNPVEFYDTVLHGEAWYFREGQFERDVIWRIYKTLLGSHKLLLACHQLSILVS